MTNMDTTFPPRTDDRAQRVALAPFPRRSAPVGAVAILGLAGAAWWWTTVEAKHMSSMVDGIAQVGRSMAFHMSPLAFAWMWAAMMAAMMLPGVLALLIARPVLITRPVGLSRIGSGVAQTALLAGYLAVWASVFVVPFAVLVALGHVTRASAWLDRTGGLLLLLAGAYQLTSQKRALLVAWRGRPAPHPGSISLDGLRAGLSRGWCCVRCSGPLMVVLLVAGLMNLWWMAAVTVACLAEKCWARPGRPAMLTSMVLVGLGMAVLVHPAALAAISSTSSVTPMMHR